MKPTKVGISPYNAYAYVLLGSLISGVFAFEVSPKPGKRERRLSLLGGSGDLVSKVISPLIGLISNYKYSYLIYNPSY